MTADDFISAAISRGQSVGLASLKAEERWVFLISEAEVDCDLNGIDTFLDRYPAEVVMEAATAFEKIGAMDVAKSLRQVWGELPKRVEASLQHADSLIKNREGYDYEAIRAAVGRNA